MPRSKCFLRSQEEVNSFVADYPNCTIINENLTISTSFANNAYPIESLIELEKIIAIKGSLNIYSNNNLNDLSGLQNITSIGEGLNIYLNNKLNNLDGLTGLKTIGGSLAISRNGTLEKFRWFNWFNNNWRIFNYT